MHFGCYSLKAISKNPELLYTLGGGVLVQIAQEFNFDLPRANEDGTGELLPPTPELLSALTAKVAPHAHLQKNIAFVTETLGDKAHDICAAWLDATHATDPIAGAFVDPTIGLPEYFDYMLWSGSVANWQQRRFETAARIKPRSVGEVLLPMSDINTLAAGQHTMVETYVEEHGYLPSQAQFAEWFTVPALAAIGFRHVNLVPITQKKGDDVLTAFLRRYPQVVAPGVKTLIVGNAPNTIQAAGQFRDMARAFDPSYDGDGTQLYMIGDAVRIARPGENAAHGQNPISGLGQILRNFKLLLDNAVKAA